MQYANIFGTGKRKLNYEQVAAVISADPVISCVPTGSLCTFLEVLLQYSGLALFFIGMLDLQLKSKKN